MTKKNLAWKKFKKWNLSFFMSGIPHDLAQKTGNVPKWAFFDNIGKTPKDLSEGNQELIQLFEL